MARTKSLKKLANDYVAALENAGATWGEVAGTQRRKTAAEDIFLRMAVGWEEFVSEWFIGALNHDATRYKARQEQKLKAWLDDAVKRSDYAQFAEFFRPPILSIGSFPRVAVVRRLLVPREGNLAFHSFEELRKRSADCLDRKFADRVGRIKSFGGDEIINSTLAIRNFLAHRSTQALLEMNRSVAAFPGFSVLRKQSMSRDGIGTYLATTKGGVTRLLLFKSELERITRILAPYD